MMQYRDLKIGDAIPQAAIRAPFYGPVEPAWYVMQCDRTRGGMIAAREWLVKMGADDAWFPEEQARRQIKRAGKLFREMYQRPVVPGIVFVLTALQPQWDVIAERRRIKPLMIAGTPVAVTPNVLACMAQVPQRIDAMRKAEIEAKMLRVGDSAKFTAGVFEGRIVQVETIRGNEALVLIEGVKVWANTHGLERRK